MLVDSPSNSPSNSTSRPSANELLVSSYVSYGEPICSGVRGSHVTDCLSCAAKEDCVYIAGAGEKVTCDE